MSRVTESTSTYASCASCVVLCKFDNKRRIILRKLVGRHYYELQSKKVIFSIATEYKKSLRSIHKKRHNILKYKHLHVNT